MAHCVGKDGQSWYSQRYVVLIMINFILSLTITALPAGHLDFAPSVEHSHGLALVLLHSDATGHCAGASESNVSAFGAVLYQHQLYVLTAVQLGE